MVHRGAAVGKYLKDLFPIVTWIPRYNKEWAVGDALAGLTVGMMVVPQSLAYAKIIGLPIQHGLYSSFVGVLLYMFFGTSKDVTIGPTSVLTLLVAQTVAASQQLSDGMGLAAFACTLAFLAGIIELIVGFLRLGQFVEFISAPAITGFTCGAAIVTQISQFPSLFGIVGVNNNRAAYRVLFDTLSVANRIKYDAFIGLGVFFFLVLWRMMCRRLVAKGMNWAALLGHAGNAISLVIFTVITFLVNNISQNTIRVFGEIPVGLSYFKLPTITNLTELLPASATVVLVAIIEHIAITKNSGRENGYHVEPNQEIIALGFSNLVGSFFGSFPVTGSFSRSAVQSKSGVKTPLAGILTGFVVLFSIYLLTGVFAHIPNASLAAVICFNLMNLIVKPAYLKALWRVDKSDFLVFMLSFWVQMFTNIQTGIYCSVIYSILAMLYKISRPTVHSLVQEPSGNWVVNKGTEGDTCGAPVGIAVFRIDESLVFSNASYVNSIIFRWTTSCTRQLVDPTRKKLWCEGSLHLDHTLPDLWPNRVTTDSKPLLRGVILDMSCVSTMDCTGLASLIEIRRDLQRHSGGRIEWKFAHMRNSLQKYLTEFEVEFGDSKTSFKSIDSAIYSLATKHNSSDSKRESKIDISECTL